MLNKSSTFGVNGGFGSTKKKSSINFSKANTAFCVSLNYNADNNNLFVCLFLNEIVKFKADNKNVNFPTHFCLGSMKKCTIFQLIKILLADLTY